jgi:hypothetical protein
MPATGPADVDRALNAGNPPPSSLSAEERRAYEQLEGTFKQAEYTRYMAARPQTLYGIADSPVGLAAWLLDHNDADGQPAAAVVEALDRITSDTGELTSVARSSTTSRSTGSNPVAPIREALRLSGASSDRPPPGESGSGAYS